MEPNLPNSNCICYHIVNIGQGLFAALLKKNKNRNNWESEAVWLKNLVAYYYSCAVQVVTQMIKNCKMKVRFLTKHSVGKHKWVHHSPMVNQLLRELNKIN